MCQISLTEEARTDFLVLRTFLGVRALVIPRSLVYRYQEASNIEMSELWIALAQTAADLLPLNCTDLNWRDLSK